MKNSKCILLLFSLCLFLGNCYSDNSNSVPKDSHILAYSKLQLTAYLGGIIYADTSPTIHIATTLYNPTEDTIQFVSMSCTYEDLFLTDDSIFIIQSRYDCYDTYPIIQKLPPKSKIDHYLMIRAKNKEFKVWNYKKIKIGMHIIDFKDKFYFEDLEKNVQKFEEVLNRSEILWSSQLDLNKLYRNSYK